MIGKPLKVGRQRNFGRNISITEDEVSLDARDVAGITTVWEIREAAEAGRKREIERNAVKMRT